MNKLLEKYYLCKNIHSTAKDFVNYIQNNSTEADSIILEVLSANNDNKSFKVLLNKNDEEYTQFFELIKLLELIYAKKVKEIEKAVTVISSERVTNYVC